MATLTLDLIIGSIFVILAVIFWAYLAFRLLKKYSEDKVKQNLYLGLAFVSGTVAGLSLLAIHLTLTINVPPNVSESPQFSHFLDSSLLTDPTYWMTAISIIIAIISSSFIFIFLDWFALSFQENRDKIIIVPVILIGIFIILYLFTPFKFRKVGNDWQTTHVDPLMGLILILLLIIPLFFSGVFMLLVTVQRWMNVGGDSVLKRMIILTVGLFVFIISYILEVGTPHPALTLLARFDFFVFGMLMYIGIMPPSLVRQWLGD